MSRRPAGDSIDVHVGKRVRERRVQMGMSQKNLAEAVGVSFQQIQKNERGTNRIGASRMFELSKVLDVPVSFFFDDLPPQPPIKTVGQPATTLPPCAVVSPIRTAGLPVIITVADPLTSESGGPTQVALSPITAAGNPPIKTVAAPGPRIGPPTCGIGGVPGVCIGQACMSVRRAAGGIGFVP